MTGNSRSPLANVRSLHSPRATMKVSMLSRLSFLELENLGIEKKNFDCAEVVFRYSDMGTDKIEEALGVETIGIGADPTVDFGWETNGGGCWILADMLKALPYRRRKILSPHPEPPNCPKIKLALWFRDSAPEVLKVVSEQPPDFEGLIPPRLENHSLDFLKEELLLS